MHASAFISIGEKENKAKCLGCRKIPGRRATGLGTDWEGVLEFEQKKCCLQGNGASHALYRQTQNCSEGIHSSVASSAFELE